MTTISNINTRAKPRGLEEKVTETHYPKAYKYLFLDAPLYQRLKKLKSGTPSQRVLGHTLGNVFYGAVGTVLTFPLGNVLPGDLQRKGLEQQGRHKLTYTLWGLGSDIAWQGAKAWAMLEAVSTDTNLGYGVAGTLGVWMSYKAIEIPARIGLIAWRKEPVPFLIIEAVYQGLIKTRKVIQRLNPLLKISDTIKSARKLYSSNKNI